MKKVFKYFTIMQYKAEEEFLREMHRHGWKFAEVSGFGMYSFEECEPQDVVYRIDYNKDGIYHKNEYVQLFNDCGWEYMQDYLGYSYFRKPASEDNADDDIFCDDESRMQMVSRVVRGRLLPIMILFFCVVSQFILSLYNHNFVLANICAVILIVYATIFVSFWTEYRRFMSRME